MLRKNGSETWSKMIQYGFCHTFFYLIKKNHFFSIEIEALKAELSGTKKKNQL